MNNERRKKIKDIIEVLKNINKKLDKIQGEEQNAIDNTPESLQDTNNYHYAEECIEIIESSCIDIDMVIEELEKIY